eukprot:TRINITY_DN6859_c0_g1_i1.p1 TRINITY_DN6859_c0_g1~~TRINITY_DN6859_c0_g1_i1.p1  ORF type:complete len:1546 (+),score=230.97 TRINITY_DN6859_c0_g1_i1:833-5470(+)
MQTHAHAIACTNKLVRLLGESYLKVLKGHFFETDEKRLDREGFVRAVHATLEAWVGEQHMRDGLHYSDETDKIAVKRQLAMVLKDFTPARLGHLFLQLDCDKDGKIDWMDVSTFMVEGAAIKQTIKQFQDKPDVKEWEGKEVDRIVFIEAWRKLVLCTQSKMVYVCTTSGAPYAEFVGHKSSVMNATYLTAIDRLCTASSDSTIIIWDEKQRAVLKQLPFPQPVLCMVSIKLESVSYLYVAGLDQHIKGYSMDSLMTWHPQDMQGLQEERQVWNSPGALSEDDKKHRRMFKKLDDDSSGSDCDRQVKKKLPVLSSSDEETKGPVAELKRKRKRRKREDAHAMPDSKKYPTPSIKFTSGHDDWVTELLIISDLRLVISASLDKTIRVWDMFTGELRYKKVGHTKGVLSLCYMEEYKLLISSGYGKEVCVWNPFTPNGALATLAGHEKQVLGVSYFPNTPTCVSMDVQGRLIVWDIRSYTQVQNLGGSLNKYIPVPIACYCLDAEEGLLISMGKVMSWYKVRESAHIHKMKQPISHILVSQQKEVVVLAAGSKFYTYSLLDGRLIMAHERLSGCEISGLCWCSDDCGFLAVGNTDGRVKIVNTDSGAVAGTFKVSSPSAVSALFRVKTISDARGRMRHKETRLLLILLSSGQLIVVNQSRLNNERPVLKHQTIIGGPQHPDAEVTLSCYSPAMNSVVVFGTSANTNTYLMEAWKLNSLEAPLYSDKLSSNVTACCMLDDRSCMLTCNAEGKLWVWNQHNMILMIEVMLAPAGDGPFVATSIGFNESELGIVMTDEKRVKIVSFTWIVCQFFEVHKDASWNLVSAPEDQELFRGRYVIEKVIRGTCNEVMLGVDLRLNKRVALKAVNDLEEYHNEVELYNTLTKSGSEGVIRLFDHWVDDKGPAHLVLECGGKTLWDVTHQKGKQVSAIGTAEELRSIAEGITRGLVEIHKAGYIHGDIKSKNVVQFSRTWKIIDLDSCSRIGQPLALEFTPFYCPPEMAKKRKNGNDLAAHPSFDLWSLGAVIYECLCGERLFSSHDTCESVVDWLASEDLVVNNFVNSRLQRATSLNPLLGTLLTGVLVSDPILRKDTQWCWELLASGGYLTDSAPAPVELRPFPSSVPQNISLLKMCETDFSGEEALFKTVATPCSLITATAMCEPPSTILLADHDAYSSLSLLRAYSLRMDYHGRLPTNDYDDTDTNWHFPLHRDIQDPRHEKEPDAKKESSQGDWVTRSPSILLKTFSWKDLQKRIADVSTTGDDRDQKACLTRLTDDISPFFSEWKKSGIAYNPVSTFYAKNHTPVPRQKNKRTGLPVNTGDGSRDLDFIRTLPKTMKADTPPSRIVPRERCFCGKSLVGQQLQDVHKSITTRITKKEGIVCDSTLWIQPPGSLKTSQGSHPKWVADADALLGMDKAAKCPSGHVLKDVKTSIEVTYCDSCHQTSFPCCSFLKHCGLCSYHQCDACSKDMRSALKRNLKHLEHPQTPALASIVQRPLGTPATPYETYGGVKIPVSAMTKARNKSIQRDREMKDSRSPPRLHLNNVNGRPKVI